jgi:1-acyl-sn-glycerol-3-phosphate acyltransferase
VSEQPKLKLDVSKSLTYRVVAGLVVGLSKVFFRPDVVGAENIPRSGPVLIAPIHRSNVDFVFTLFISPRCSTCRCSVGSSRTWARSRCDEDRPTASR